MIARRRGACSAEDPLGDLHALFPDLPRPVHRTTARPEPVPLRTTVPSAAVTARSAPDTPREPAPSAALPRRRVRGS